MARRRTATLALAVLALALSGCGAAHAGSAPARRPSAVALPDNGDDQPEPAPSTSTSDAPPPAGPKPATPPAGPKVPAKSNSTGPATPVNNTAHGHGPSGSMTSTGTSAVALTFDDGPFANSNQVLDLLAQYHVKATFCVIGRQVAEYAAVIRRIVAEGHTLCNHTWSHDLNLHTRSPDQIQAEIQKTSDAIHAIVPGAPIKYFRAPGGNWSDQIVSIAASLGMTPLHWSADPQDWRRPPPQAIINYVFSHTGPGSIVLMHDGGGDRSNTVTALRTILPNLAGRLTLIALPTT